MGEDDKLAPKNEDEAALRKVAEDEMLARSSSSRSSEGSFRQHRAGERSRLVRGPDDEDDTSHGFAESVRKEKGT